MAMSLQDAIADYQRRNPYSPAAFDALFADLTSKGFQVARTTHAGNTKASADALVDSSGRVYDLVFNSDNAPGAGAPKWVLNDAGTYDPGRKVVGPDGTFIGFSDWTAQLGVTPKPSGGGPTGGNATALGGGRPNMNLPGGYRKGPRPYRPPKPTNTGTPTPSGPNTTSDADMYAAAYSAQNRTRQKNRGGRQATILGGFGGGRPATRPATLLGY